MPFSLKPFRLKSAWRQLFSRPRRPRLRRPCRFRQATIESLEPRLALSAVPIETPQNGALVGGWNALILTEDGDEVYVRATQEVVNGSQLRDVFSYSDTPQFAPGQGTGFVFNNSSYGTLLVQNGALTTIADVTFPTSNSTSFVFPRAADPDGPGGIGILDPTDPSGRHIAGTQQGFISIDGLPGQIEFRPQELRDTGSVDLVFRRNGGDLWAERPGAPPDDNPNSAGYYLFTPNVTATSYVGVAGTFNYDTGALVFSFLHHFGSDPDVWRPYTPTQVNLTASSYEVVDAETPSIFQAVPGRDFNVGLRVNLSAADSEIQINSTVNGQFDTVLRATNVLASAPVATTANIFVASQEPTVVERVVFDGAVSANQIGFDLQNDLATTSRDRGLISLAPSASITADNLLANTSEVDIVYEGLVNVGSQSYSFQTSTAAQPFRFVTTNSSGQSVGRIQGNAVDILLSNLDQVNGQDVITHEISLDTRVNDLRIGAAFGESEAGITPPYRYAIDVREQQSISFNAALASGGPVSIASGGSISLNAAMRVFGDFSISATGNVTGDASVATVGGAISLQAAALDLNGRLQTFDRRIDERLDDVSLVATAGGIDMRGAVSATNTVSINQSGNGNVSSDDRVTAGKLSVDAAGNVDLFTAAPQIDVFAGGSVTIRDAAATEVEVSTSGIVSLSAAGRDVPDPNSPGDLLAALRAVVRRASEVSFAAPDGSVDAIVLDVESTTTNPGRDVIVGDRQAIINRSATSSGAAGEVSITTEFGGITVLDAPRQGFGRLRAKALSDNELTGTYIQNNPGIEPATLTGLSVGVDFYGDPYYENINDIANIAGIFPADDASTAGVELLVRDLVVLKDQANKFENGLYQIMNVGSRLQPWQLRRVPFADTTAELAVHSRIAILQGKFATQTVAVDEYINVQGSTPLQVTQGLVRGPDEIEARFATSGPLDGTYALNAAGSDYEITANPTSFGPLQVTGKNVAIGDVILVWHGTINDPGPRDPGSISRNYDSYESNGLYRVVDDGAGSGAWRLERLRNIEVNPITPPVVEEATVVVTEGRYRTAYTGMTFTVAYDGLGIVPLVFGAPRQVDAKIGSLNPRNPTTFVVSSNGGTNEAPGSLGKTLAQINANAAKDFVGSLVEQGVVFANAFSSPNGLTGVIQLHQELPEISRPIVIDASNRFQLNGAVTLPIEIDGSRITSTRGQEFVTTGVVVDGITYTAASSAVLPAPTDARQSVLRGLSLRGFSKGAAVKVAGASNMLLDDLTIGRGIGGVIGASKFGVLVTDGDDNGTPIGAGKNGPVTISNTDIFASLVFTGFNPTNQTQPLSGVGIRIEGASQGVQIVASEVGDASGTNTLGIVVESTNKDTDRYNTIGVNPVSETIEALGGFDTVAGESSLIIEQNLWDVIGNDLYLGQTVSGDGFNSGTTIIHIAPSTRELVFSQAMTGSVTDASVQFESPGRNVIQENYFGVELRSGATRMTNTTVANNIIDGVVLGAKAGFAPAIPELWAEIGAGIAIDESAGSPSRRVLSSASNSIFGNDRYGIRFADSINSVTPLGPLGGKIVIEGNFVGTDTAGTAGLLNGATYYWDQTNSSTAPPAGFEGLLRQSADPDDDPRIDDFGGNINARLAPAQTGGGVPQPPQPPGPIDPTDPPPWDEDLPSPT